MDITDKVKQAISKPTTEKKGYSDEDRTPIICRKIDLDSDLPDQTENEDFQTVPIQNFGDHIMQVLGYSKERGIGSSKSNQMENPIQFKPRPGGLGVGAVPKKEIIDKIRRGEIVTNEDLIKKDNRNYFFIGGKNGANANPNNEENQAAYGDKVSITEGKYSGLDGILMEVDEKARSAIVQLSLNKMNVSISTKNLKKGGKKDIQKKTKKAIKNKTKSSSSTTDKNRLKWVTTGIQVKIISKKYKEGKYYLSKGQILDVRDQFTFDFLAENGQIFDNLKEKQLQTVIPKMGQQVLIVKGEHKGKLAKLLTKTKKSKNVSVQLMEDSSIQEITNDMCSSVAN